MEKVFIDTSAWVALFVENDANHEKAAAIFEKIKHLRTPVFTSDYVIDETITTILARGNHQQSVGAGEALFKSEIIKIIYIAPDHIQDTWLLYKKYKDKKFSFTDVSCISVMKTFNVSKAFSFDREFIQAGIELVS